MRIEKEGRKGNAGGQIWGRCAGISAEMFSRLWHRHLSLLSAPKSLARSPPLFTLSHSNQPVPALVPQRVGLVAFTAGFYTPRPATFFSW